MARIRTAALDVPHSAASVGPLARVGQRPGSDHRHGYSLRSISYANRRTFGAYDDRLAGGPGTTSSEHGQLLRQRRDSGISMRRTSFAVLLVAGAALALAGCSSSSSPTAGSSGPAAAATVSTPTPSDTSS